MSIDEKPLVVTRKDIEEAKSYLREQASFDLDEFLEEIKDPELLAKPLGPKSDCLSILEVGDYVSRELSEQRFKEVNEHLKLCADCRENIHIHKKVSDPEETSAFSISEEKPLVVTRKDIEEAKTYFREHASFNLDSFLEEIKDSDVLMAKPLGPTANCLSILDVADYVNGILTHSRRKEAEDHLKQCADCRENIHIYEKVSTPDHKPFPVELFSTKAIKTTSEKIDVVLGSPTKGMLRDIVPESLKLEGAVSGKYLEIQTVENAQKFGEEAVAVKFQITGYSKLVKSGKFMDKVEILGDTRQGESFQASTMFVIENPIQSSKYVGSWFTEKFRLRELVAAILLLVGIGGLIRMFRSTPQMIAFQPFRVRSDSPELKLLANSMPFSNQLLVDNHLVAVGDYTASHLAAIKDPRAEAKSLKIAALFDGELSKVNGQLRIQTALYDIKKGTYIWKTEQPKDLLALQQILSQEIPKQMGYKISAEEMQKIAARSTKSSEAFRLYLEGRYYHWNKRTPGDLEKALDSFQKALSFDQNYSLAHAALADCYAVMGEHGLRSGEQVFPLALQEAEKAISADETLAQPYATKGLISLNKWDWTRAESEFQRAIKLEPSYAPAHHWYSLLLTYQGRLDEGRTQIEEALKIDPRSSSFKMALGFIEYSSGNSELAIRNFNEAIDLNPDLATAYLGLGLAYMKEDKVDKAGEAFFKGANAEKLSAQNLEFLRKGLDDAGLKGYFANRIVLLKDALARKEYVSRFEIAFYYTLLGERESAISELENAYRERDPGLVRLKVMPPPDILESDPRYKELLRQLRFPE